MSYHLYLVTDPNGCWPLLSETPLPWRSMRTDYLLIFPRGRFGTMEEALEAAAEVRRIAAEQEGTPLQRAIERWREEN
jgi:hypothetical protein